jgi:peroxiredoxin
VLGASYDKVDANRAFCEKFSFPFKLLTFDKVTGSTWGASDSSDPDYPRRISYLIGPDRKIVKAYATVNPKAHPAEVLTDIRSQG